MFDKKPKDRLAAHKEFEENNAKMKQYSTKAVEKEKELYTKISEEIRNTGTIELRELWTEYSINLFISKTAHMIDMASLNSISMLEKQFAHNNLKCMKEGCDDYLVSDALYNKVEDEPGELKEKLVTKENCFVCLGCGSKYRLVKA